MGFTSVFMALLEVFPQVDPRILRAVAIENSNDADVAVSVVLAEVMPSLSVQSGIGSGGSFSDQGLSLLNPFEDVQASDIAGGNDGLSEETVIDEQIPSTKPVESNRVEFGNFDLNSIVSGPNTAANESHTQVYVNGFGKNVSLPERHNAEAGPKDISRAMADEFLNNILNDTDGSVYFSFPDEEQSKDELVRKNHRSVSQLADVDPSTVQIFSLNVPESSSKLVTEPVSPVTKVGEPEADVPSLMVSGEDITFSEMVDSEDVDISNIVSDISIKDLEKEPNGVKDLFTTEVNDFEDESSMKATVTSRTGQMCTTELLEDIIENEKTEKIALRSARDSLFSLISEVQMKEKYVQKAREEAVQGGLDTFARVEDLTKMLQRAKEATDMYAGEVYGEKAILATELRELQSRLRILSDERVKALAIINEIHQALEVRLLSAEEEIKEAESEKLKKEESALIYLAQEESNMEKVVQESKILEQQAEENSKLREFLMDRGQLVDILQGEISVICQDVEFLKSKFERGDPFRKSVSSSQTTSISTFSRSSVVGASFEKVPEVVASPENRKESSSDSDDDLVSTDEVPSTGKEIVDDDDWNLLDAQEFRIYNLGCIEVTILKVTYDNNGTTVSPRISKFLVSCQTMEEIEDNLMALMDSI
ncbi:nuclear mitotic apparatus protein 1-like [Heracleum sosnowskyi]|uniref:Nuclear mitotic apparatus protein 1-like n=1 Tax=Heracleum sosnowskyi TaxID=360622 RepID=A0AAD8N6W4_9APIA|nr:nuclear mitotic apparatus protein 1-like [Heracleum sosnowskyi]